MRSDPEDSAARGGERQRPKARWGPAALVAAVIAAGSFTLGSQAGAADDLPDKTAAEILALIAEQDVSSFFGLVEQTSELGIPQISTEVGPPGAGGTSALELLTASHRARVYVDGPRLRVQILDGLSQRDLIVTEDAVWFHDFSENTATRLALPPELAAGPGGELPEGLLDELPEGFLDELPEGMLDDLPEGMLDNLPQGMLDELPEGFLDEVPSDSRPSEADVLDGGAAVEPGGADAWPSGHDLPFRAGATPVEVAESMLAAIESGAQVTVGADTEVAGRSAYAVVLTPSSADTLVGSISIAADAETGMPLSVVIRARDQEKPAWSLAFTTLSLETPDPDLFDFAPPAGTTIKDPLSDAVDLDGTPRDASGGDGATGPEAAADGPEPTVHGSGWEVVVELPAESGDSDVLADPMLAQLLTEVPGGRALTTSLLNALVTDDGRVLVGSVTLDRLRAVAAQ